MSTLGPFAAALSRDGGGGGGVRGAEVLLGVFGCGKCYRESNPQIKITAGTFQLCRPNTQRALNFFCKDQQGPSCS